MNEMVFQFFFEATAGIAAGIAVVVLPTLWILKRSGNFSGLRRARG